LHTEHCHFFIDFLLKGLVCYDPFNFGRFNAFQHTCISYAMPLWQPKNVVIIRTKYARFRFRRVLLKYSFWEMKEGDVYTCDACGLELKATKPSNPHNPGEGR